MQSSEKEPRKKKEEIRSSRNSDSKTFQNGSKGPGLLEGEEGEKPHALRRPQGFEGISEVSEEHGVFQYIPKREEDASQKKRTEMEILSTSTGTEGNAIKMAPVENQRRAGGAVNRKGRKASPRSFLEGKTEGKKGVLTEGKSLGCWPPPRR